MADLIENILDKTLIKLGISEKVKEKRVLDLWNQIIGKEIKKHTQAKYINQGVLFITVDSSVWTHQLYFMKKDFINKINEKIGNKIVEDIRFQSGKIFSLKVEEKTNINYDKINLNNNEIKEIMSISNSISDNDLKEKFYNLLETDLKIKKWKKENGWVLCKECLVLIPPEENKCIICKLKSKNKKLNINELKETLTNTPWLSYKEILDIYPNILEKEFEIIKNQLIREFKNELDNLMAKVLKKEIDSNEVKVFIQKYVILEAGVHPEHLNNRLIQRIIGGNYMKIYNSL